MQFAGKIKTLFLRFFRGGNMRIAYVRVSTEEQNEARQREALKLYHLEKWYCEKRSAKDTNRPQLESMLEFARSGDVIYIHDFSRLARNRQDLLERVRRMQQKGIQLVSCRESVDTETATGKLMLTMIAAINEFERAILLERQKEGIAIAKREHRYKGRKKISKSEDFGQLFEKYQKHEISKSEIARQLKVSRPTVDRLILEEKEKRV